MSTTESAVDFTPGPLDRTAGIFVAGHRGMIDAAIHRKLAAAGFSELMERPGSDVDLDDRRATFEFFGRYRPQVVILVGRHPGVPTAEPSQLEDNVLAAAMHTGVHRLLFIAASGHQRIQDARRGCGLAWISARPTGLHGPSLDPTLGSSDVLSALIQRYDRGHAGAEPVVTNPGSDDSRLELLHVDDLADACLHLLECFDGPQVVNVGAGADHTVGDIADVVATAIGYAGETRWDTTEPDAPPCAPLDVSTLRASGWRPSLSMIQGIVATVSWYQSHQASLRR